MICTSALNFNNMEGVVIEFCNHLYDYVHALEYGICSALNCESVVF